MGKQGYNVESRIKLRDLPLMNSIFIHKDHQVSTAYPIMLQESWDIHIFTYEFTRRNQPNVGKIPYMDVMGMGNPGQFHKISQRRHDSS